MSILVSFEKENYFLLTILIVLYFLVSLFYVISIADSQLHNLNFLQVIVQGKVETLLSFLTDLTEIANNGGWLWLTHTMSDIGVHIFSKLEFFHKYSSAN